MASRWITLAVILFHTLPASVHSVNAASESRTQVALRSKAKAKAKAEEDFRDVFQSPTMLLMSSPMERKVSYCVLDNFKAVKGVVLPLLDAGLMGPYGIAWDAPRSALYICDAALRKIFRVKIEAFKCEGQCKGIPYQLRTTGNKYTVVDGVVSQWAAVDNEGNLYFSDQETNSVSKLPVEDINLIIQDQLLAKNLDRTTEAEAEGEESAKESEEAVVGSESSKTHVTTPQPPSIFQFYEEKSSPHVGTPAGVFAEGPRLYWTNQVGGFSKGSVAEGKTHPRIKAPAAGDDKPSFASSMLTNQSGASYGITVTTSKVIYTEASHYVVAVSRGTGEVVALSPNLLKPRGIVWDGDNTAYVADAEGNNIVSMPVGLLKPNAPISLVVDFHNPFGLALMSNKDPIWTPFVEGKSGTPKLATLNKLVVLATLAVSAWCSA